MPESSVLVVTMAKREPRTCAECALWMDGTCYDKPMPDDMMECVLFEERDDGEQDSASD